MEIENHPIPQDITGFQFRLIGNMTVKQFAYLAGGFIIAWVFYISPIFIIIKAVFALLSAGAGAALAFVPIQGRPIDVMLVNFIRAVFKPTQYVYQQAPSDLPESEAKSINAFNRKRQTVADMSDQQLEDFLNSLPKTTPKLDKKEMVFFENINQIQQAAKPQTLPGFVPQHAFGNTPSPQPQQMPTASLPQIKPQAPTNPLQNLKRDVATFQNELKTITQKPTPTTNVAPVQNTGTQQYSEAHNKVLELQKNLSDMLLQKQQLEDKLTSLQKQMQQGQQKVYAPSVATAAPQQQQTQSVRSVPQSLAKSVGLPATPEFPNVISGIVKDPRGNPLANILVEVKDQQGNSARAFKTNALGQFASATALANGDYIVDFEDPRGQNKFDSISFKATGEIILPIEVLSVDTREELRRSLFN